MRAALLFLSAGLGLGSASCSSGDYPTPISVEQAGLAWIEAPGPGHAPSSFFAEIRPLLQRRCETCHRKGGVAPFALTTHEQVYGRRKMIQFVVEERVMPPWPAAGKGWIGDLRLSQDERDLLLSWIEAGAPAGDPQDAPAELDWPSEWSIGEPDLVIELSTPLEIPAEGVLDYVFSFEDLPLTKDCWVQAVEVLAEHPKANHHIFVHVVDSDGNEQFLGGLLPGQSAIKYPPGMARFLPDKFKQVRFQHHLTPFGKAVLERTRVGFVFAEEAPQRAVRSGKFGTIKLSIPPGAPAHVVEIVRPLRHELAIRSLLPHMHLRGSEITVDAELPDGRRVRLLDVPRWDPDWQLQYKFERMPILPAGSTLVVRGTYDNSADNPLNPDPSRRVVWGEQIWDEMLSLYVEFVDP